jgi:hypothetical protein
MAKTVGTLLQVVAPLFGPWGIILAYIGSEIVKGEEESEARRRAIRAYNSSLQDRTIVVRGAVSPRRFVLGRARLGYTLAYLDTVGASKEKLDEVGLVCDGPIKAIAGMWLGDVFYPASGFTSGAPVTGQYSATNRKAFSGYFNVYLTDTDSFTVDHTPRSAADVFASTVVNVEDGYVDLVVSSVSGTTVTLDQVMTGPAVGTYNWVTTEVPYQVQWVLGGRQQAATTWAGVTTPKWTANHRLQGIAYFRSLCDWDENIFAQGKPAENLLVDGVMPHDLRYNLNPVYPLTGSVAGTPGTLPTNVSTSGITSGLGREVVGSGSEDGVPYFDIRISGTTSASGQVQIRLPQASAAPAAAPGQSWKGRVHLRVLSGALTQFASSNFALVSYDTGGTGTTETSTNLSAVIAAYPLRDAVVEVTDASAGASAVKMGSFVRLNYSSGATIDITLRIGLPQLWRTTDPVQWTTNPAILAGWWMLTPRRDGGMGIPFSWIDWATVIAAANICDETISVKKLDGTGYEDVKRYECNTVVSTDAAPADNLSIILGAMAGYRAFTAGLYRIFAGAYRTPTRTLTDSDVDRESPLRFYPHSVGFDKSPNVMNGRIADAARNYVETGVTPVVNEFYVELDGGEEPDERDLSATTDARQAQYLLGVELEQRRPRMACELTATGAQGADMALGDTLLLTLEGYDDFASITFEVVDRGNAFNGKYWLRLVEMRSSDYALDPDRFTPVDQPVPPDNSYLWNVDELSAFEATVNVPTRLPDGTVVLVIHCSWDLHGQAYVRQSGRIEIRWRKIDGDAWSGPVEVDGDETAADINLGAYDNSRYVVQARARNGLPAWSEWVTDVVDSASDGQLDGISLVLGTPAMVLPANNAGHVTNFASGTSTVKVFRNGTDETGGWALSRTNSSGIGSTLSAGVVSVTSMSDAVDAGYIDVTATRTGYPTQTHRISIVKARAGADGSSAFTATATANMSWAGGIAERISGGGAWDASVRSDQAYPGGAGLAFVADTADKTLAIGLNSDPTTNADYASIDYALYLRSDAVLLVYEGGVSQGSFGSYAVDDVFAIIYDGENVIYYRNGTPIKTTAAAANQLLYLDSSFFHLAAKVSSVTYGQGRGCEAAAAQHHVTGVSGQQGRQPEPQQHHAHGQCAEPDRLAHVQRHCRHRHSDGNGQLARAHLCQPDDRHRHHSGEPGWPDGHHHRRQGPRRRRRHCRVAQQ